MHHPHEHKTVRRILLPSGRAIEIVSFHGDEQGLHVCPECGSHLVQPIDWHEAPRGFWDLTLRCPNCEWLDEGIFDHDQVQALEEKLDEGLTDILCDLRRLTQSNMAEEIERFATALQSDLVLPEDF